MSSSFAVGGQEVRAPAGGCSAVRLKRCDRAGRALGDARGWGVA
ncbi:hypothetical protein ATKI12_4189 [Kitasatospora sp. Ki12]